jgi:hypothetical protein
VTDGAPTLERIAGGTVVAEHLHGRTVVFVESDCPTCTLALRRLGGAAADVTVLFEDPPATAARVARRLGFHGDVLAEPAPYRLSEQHGVVTVPTTIRFDADGAEAARVVGWDRDRLATLLAVDLGSEGPATKPGCGARWTYAPPPPMDEYEEMFDLGYTDGLPVVPPTPERVAAMLGGRDPGRSLGPVPPGQGEATLERVAACAVLAGCRPDYFGVVLAACEAALDERFNLNGLAVTTSPPGQILIVNGPVRGAIGLHSGVGALGPGWRANLTIGRALRLLVTLTGRGAPGGLDRGTLGHMGKLSTCIAEDEETSPWEPLHVERGLAPGTSAVTLVGGDAPLSIADHRSTTPRRLAATLGWAAAATWSPNWWPLADARSLFVICPEHAALFAAASWSKQDVREAIFAAPVRRGGDLTGFGEAAAAAHEQPDAEFRKWETPDDILLVVAGGEAGRFSAVFGPCLGMGSTPITREIR